MPGLVTQYLSLSLYPGSAPLVGFESRIISITFLFAIHLLFLVWSPNIPTDVNRTPTKAKPFFLFPSHRRERKTTSTTSINLKKKKVSLRHLLSH